MTEGIDTFNRVDNIIEFTPSPLTNFFTNNQPDGIANMDLNFNPLEISKSKVTLAHTAKVQSISPLLRTKLVLKSVILNVAGTSKYLEPNGNDIFGLNVPLGDLFNFGSFDTTYVDDEIRISRGKVGLVHQLRIFVRVSEETPVNIVEASVDVIDEVKEVPGKIREALDDIDEVLNGAEEINEVLETSSDATDAIVGLATIAFEKVENTLESAVTEEVKKVPEEIKEDLQVAIAIIDEVQKTEEFAEKLGVSSDSIDKVQEVTEGVKEDMEALIDIVDEVEEVVEDFTESFFDKVNEVTEEVKEAFEGKTETASDDNEEEKQ